MPAQGKNTTLTQYTDLANRRIDGVVIPTLFKTEAAEKEVVIKSIQPIHRGVGNGQCVPYARKVSGINLFGVARTWIVQAPRYGYGVTDRPSVGAVVVTNESKAGHVAVVTSVSEDTFTVIEQNYKGPFIISTRVLNVHNTKILGFVVK